MKGKASQLCFCFTVGTDKLSLTFLATPPEWHVITFLKFSITVVAH